MIRVDDLHLEPFALAPAASATSPFSFSGDNGNGAEPDGPFGDPRRGAGCNQRKPRPAETATSGADMESAGQQFRLAIRHNHSVLMELRQWLARVEKLYETSRDDFALTGFDKASDEILLNRMELMGIFAERMLDEAEAIERNMAILESIKADGSLWNVEAESLLVEQRAVLAVLKWAEHAARCWLNQICDEYECRHPELPPLPFEPLDLGPTNAARLPEVL